MSSYWSARFLEHLSDQHCLFSLWGGVECLNIPAEKAWTINFGCIVYCTSLLLSFLELYCTERTTCLGHFWPPLDKLLKEKLWLLIEGWNKTDTEIMETLQITHKALHIFTVSQQTDLLFLVKLQIPFFVLYQTVVWICFMDQNKYMNK